MGSSISYVRKISRKINISYPQIQNQCTKLTFLSRLIHIPACAYQGVRNVSFSENFSLVLNGWPNICNFVKLEQQWIEYHVIIYDKTCNHLKQKGGDFLEFFLLCFFLLKMLRIHRSLRSMLFFPVWPTNFYLIGQITGTKWMNVWLVTDINCQLIFFPD